jgi:hypothetical protein
MTTYSTPSTPLDSLSNVTPLPTSFHDPHPSQQSGGGSAQDVGSTDRSHRYQVALAREVSAGPLSRVIQEENVGLAARRPEPQEDGLREESREQGY